MKKNSLFKVARYAWVMIMALALFTTSCKKDSDTTDNGGGGSVIVLDGTYVKGAGTALTDFDTKGKMTVARNEVTQEDRASLMELYIAVKAGSEGFNIYTVEGSTTKTWGPGADFAEVTELDGDEPTLGLWRGSLVESETPFTVTEDGLYHVAFDSELGIVTVARVEWGVIGAATPGGWGESTQLATTFDLNAMTFTATDVTMTKGDFKFRYSNGWKVILDPDFDLGDGNTGVKVNANFGGAVDALVPGGANIVNDTPGKYTITVSWALDGGTTASVEKTGDLETFDYTNTELGLVGDGIINADTALGWNYTIMLHTPTVTDETTYTWTYEGVEVSTAGSFKIREGQTWDDKVIGYPDVTMGGTAAADFETNDDGNFVPTVDGTYDFELVIDAITETYTVNVKAAGSANPEMYMLGDGCSAGWDNTAALAMEGTGGVYTITTDLMTVDGNPGNIKFITTLGQWAPMYGSDGTGDAYSGTLQYRETESDEDPATIPVEVDGTYTVTMNTNDMTYTVEAVVSGPVLYVPGDYQGWAPDAAPTISDSDEDGVYTGTVTIPADAASFEFKFTSQPDWNGTNYGAGDTEGTLSTAGDAGNLSVPEAGTYLFTVDITNLTWTYELQ